MSSDKKAFERLPSSVKPINYKLKLQPDLTKLTFVGSEDVKIEIKEAVSTIRMNANEIDIQEAVFKGASGEVKATINLLQEEEELCLEFPSELACGEGTLSIKFTGLLNDKMRGFYRSGYKVGEETRYAAVTQFEATDARRCFPCWDEPACKATFDVTLVVPKDRVALSNMPVVNEKSCGENLQELTYDTTPIMSTYLLAFVVGEYDYVEAKDEDGVLVRVYTPKGKKEQGQFALEVAVKTLPFYKKYFKIAYPLPKCDLIAIADFSAGAMENWGLITYRETALLVDPEQSSARIKQWVALVVGHELAHQWFGNLVTMEWWTHLWLNEGFASWIEYLCVDYCFPEYDVWTQFVNNDHDRALEMDALDNSHPIEVEVGHPSEIDEIFDAISYSKGSSVIRMLHDFLGDNDFKNGMNLYLTKHQYKNTLTEHLWASLEEASGKPVAKMMNTWTSQMGFPVCKVSQDTSGDSRSLTICQTKFTADGSAPTQEYKWMVPISICSASSPSTATNLGLMDKASQTFDISSVPASSWIKVNSGTVGYFRTMYPPQMLEALVPAIKDLSLPPRDRMGLQSDLFALSRAGLTPAVEVLKVAQAFENEKDFTVWSNLTGNMAGIRHLLQYTDCHEAFKNLTMKMFSKIAASVGWDAKEGEDCLAPMLREVVLGTMGSCGHKDTVAEANRRFNDHAEGKVTLRADLRAFVFKTVLANGGDAEFEQMLKLYDSAEMQEEKVRIARSLGAVKEPHLISKVLDFALSDKVRSQDSVFVIAGTTGSAVGRDLAWKFFRNNFDKLNERYCGGFLLSRLVQSTTEGFAALEKATAVEEFFKAHPVQAAERTVQQSIENIRLNARWLQVEMPAVSKFLKTYS